MEPMTHEEDWLNMIFEDFPENTSAFYIIQCCEHLSEVLQPIFNPIGFKAKAKQFLFEKSLGSFDLMRAELEIKFNAERVTVKAEDGVNLDCLYIPAFGKREENSHPLILFCNPNAGYYEFSFYQSEWIEYYTNLGINLFLWNYRGYGLTKGWPNPTRLQKDGLIISEYLREVRNIDKLGVHGESLGGSIATYIANNARVDFLFADRTFSSLDKVAKFNFGGVAEFVFRIITRWNKTTVNDYLSAPCFKVVANDFDDTIVTDLASLKSGISQS
jgi:hypothetical protein